MPKSVINFSSSNLLKEILIALVIGLGGFTSLLPNILEGVGTIKRMTPYEAMLFFAMVYFLILLFILIAYWGIRGWKLYIIEKMIYISRKSDLFQIEKDTIAHNRTYFSYYFTIAKIVPLIVFLKGEWIFNSRIAICALIIFFLLLSCGQLCHVLAKSKRYIENYKIKPNKDFDLDKLSQIKSELHLKSVYFNTKVFVLDFFILLGFVMFSCPWLIYMDYLVHFIVAVFFLYVILFILILFRFHNRNKIEVSDKDLHYLIFYFIILAFCCVSYPAVNLTKVKGLIWVLSFIFVVAYIIYIAYLAFLRKNETIKSKVFINFLAVAVLNGFLWYVSCELNSTTADLNKDYYEGRWKATLSVSNEKYDPFFKFSIDSSCRASVDYFEKNNLRFVITGKVDTSNKQLSLYYDNLYLNYLLDHNLRKTYFGNYVLQGTGRINDLDTLSKFYGDLYKHINESLIVSLKEDSRKINDNDTLRSVFNDYSHPVNYYSALLKKYQGQLKLSSEAVSLINEIHRLIILKELRRLNQYAFQKSNLPTNAEAVLKSETKEGLRYPYRNNDKRAFVDAISKSTELEFRTNRLFKKQGKNRIELLNEEYKNVRDWDSLFAMDSKMLKSAIDKFQKPNNDVLNRKIKMRHDTLSDKLKKIIEFHDNYNELTIDLINNRDLIEEWVNFFQNFHQHKIVQYNIRFERAQIMYQSYLIDLQRTGLYLFLVQLMALIFLAVLNFYDNRNLNIRYSKKYANYDNHLAQDSPIYSLTVAIFIAFILLLPLARPIRPDNINPEEPFWMMHITNWYTPRLVKNVLNPNEPERPESYTNIEQLNLDTEPMKDMLNQLEKISTSIDDILEKMESL